MWQLLRTIAETINTLFLVLNLLTCVMRCYRSHLFSIVAFRHLTFHKVVQQHTWGVVGSLMILLLHFFLILTVKNQWNNFENRLIFDEAKAYKNCTIFGPPCIREELRWLNWSRKVAYCSQGRGHFCYLSTGFVVNYHLSDYVLCYIYFYILCLWSIKSWNSVAVKLTAFRIPFLLP